MTSPTAWILWATTFVSALSIVIVLGSVAALRRGHAPLSRALYNLLKGYILLELLAIVGSLILLAALYQLGDETAIEDAFNAYSIIGIGVRLLVAWYALRVVRILSGVEDG